MDNNTIAYYDEFLGEWIELSSSAMEALEDILHYAKEV